MIKSENYLQFIKFVTPSAYSNQKEIQSESALSINIQFLSIQIQQNSSLINLRIYDQMRLNAKRIQGTLVILTSFIFHKKIYIRVLKYLSQLICVYLSNYQLDPISKAIKNSSFLNSDLQKIVIILNLKISSPMDNQIKVVSFQFVPNSQATCHQQSELQRLAKKGILSKDILQYNNMLNEFIKQQSHHKTKISSKQLEVDRGLSDIERIQILNNTFKNKAQLVLKVPAAAHMSEKQIKSILQHQKHEN